jgi:tetratricopeptide (TPR) repeat protein
VIVGWLWFLGALIPMIGLLQVGVQQMADRYAYFPLIGLYAAIAWSVPELVANRRWMARHLATTASLVVMVLASLTYIQVGHWRDGEALMRHALDVTEDNAFSRAVLGDAIIGNGRLEDGLKEYRAGIRLAPDDPESYCRFAMMFEFLKRYEDAAEQYKLALALDENSSSLHYRLGLRYLDLKRYRDARKEMLRAVELDDENAGAYAQLATLWRAYGNFPESIRCAERALELNDSLLVCHHLIARNLRDLGRPDEADEHLLVVLAEEPENTEALEDLREVTAQLAESR